MNVRNTFKFIDILSVFKNGSHNFNPFVYILIILFIISLNSNSAYAANHYYVYYYANGGTFRDGSTVYKAVYDIGEDADDEAYTPYNDPTRDGYIFKGYKGRRTGRTYGTHQICQEDADAIWEVAHTHNSSGVEYSQNNGSVHNKYTYCSDHGTDHSQNRSSSTESHSYGSWSSWSNYSTSQQRRSRTCSKCGYVEYGYQTRPYTITYNKNGGTISKTSATINYNSTLGTLPTGSRTGYTLKGFFTAASGGSQVSSGTKVTGNATYYAQWTANNYTISYNGNGGTASTSSQTKAYDSTLGTLPTASRTGYTFNGWYTAKSGGTKITTSTKVAGNATYYAQWTARTDTKYKVEHYQMNMNGSGYTLKDTDNLTGTSDASVTPSVKSYTGFTAPSTQTTTILADGSRVVKYNYTRNKYTATFDANTGATDKSSITDFYDAELGTLPTATKVGYDFDGWFTAKTEGSEITSVTKILNNTTYYAHWTARTDTKYKVEHYLMDLDGENYTLTDTDNLQGTSDADITPSVKTYTGFTSPEAQTTTVAADGSRVIKYYYTRNKYTAAFDANTGKTDTASKTDYYDAAIGTLPTATKVGYDFDGWFTDKADGSIISSDTKILEDTAYYAHWTARTDTKYKVEHYLMDLDGENYTLTDTDNLQGTSDASITPDVKTYTGFTSPETQTTTVAADGSRLIKYYYTRNKYRFTLGSDTGVSTSMSTETGNYFYGETITLKATPSNGYKWDTWSDGNLNQAVTFTMPAQDVSMAPEVHPITYTITYDLDGGKVDFMKTTYNVETPTFYIDNPARKGFTFSGWTGTGIDSAETDLFVPLGSYGDKAFTATWDEGVYTISFEGNGNTSGSMDSITVKAGESVTLPENGFVRDGYSFVGWYTTKHDAFGTFYKKGSTISDVTESITLRVQWKKIRNAETTTTVNPTDENNKNGSNTDDNGGNTGNTGSFSGNSGTTNGGQGTSGSTDSTGGNTENTGNNGANAEGNTNNGNTDANGGNGNNTNGNSNNTGDNSNNSDNTGTNGGYNGNTGHGDVHNSNNDHKIVTPEDEIGYFGTATRRNEISISTTIGIDNKKLTLNYNY